MGARVSARRGRDQQHPANDQELPAQDSLLRLTQLRYDSQLVHDLTLALRSGALRLRLISGAKPGDPLDKLATDLALAADKATPH